MFRFLVFCSLEVASDPTPAQVGHPLARLQHEGVQVATVTSVHAAARVRRFELRYRPRRRTGTALGQRQRRVLLDQPSLLVRGVCRKAINSRHGGALEACGSQFLASTGFQR